MIVYKQTKPTSKKQVGFSMLRTVAPERKNV